ncbi:probable methyltransferase TCM_000336 [Ziziphus jujuba]|uniref:Probable methyltransferase TCM_000336 n=1 Tax=Ziziphus jujuba TaxID=326968 RepID=A0A6P4A468_ZIZJJ|nr:probable methyltransferase TCM_000336 [Ziziphus jujuba]
MIQKTSMDVEKVFHMNGGTGHTSYAKNSSYQKKASDLVKHITIETVQQLYLTTTPKSIGIADLGCSSGPNTLSVIKDIIQAVQRTSLKMLQQARTPEFRVYLNDLPTNDFNSIFKSLPDFSKEFNKDRNGGGCTSSIFIGGYPGSFYGRLFPNSCLHFVYSSYSLHWLSRIPPGLYNEQGKSINRGTVHITKTSPLEVSIAYSKQFKEDFFLFLNSRSEELVAGGKMVLILLGREGPDHIDRGNSFLWELLSRSFAILVSKGKVEGEKVDSYEVHFYAPSKEEIEEVVKREGSFEVDRLEMLKIDKDEDEDYKLESHGTKVARAVRSVQESLICHHFGEGILDSLFEIYGRMIDEEMNKEEIRPITLVLVLRKL